MLHTVQLDNFKVHRHIEVALSPVTVLVGPNGCGKSTVLEALSCLGQMAGGSPPGVVFSGPRALSEIRSAGTTEQVSLKTIGALDGSRFECSWASNDGLFALHWTDGTKTPVTSLDEILSPDPRLVRSLGAAVWRRFDPRELARPESSEEIEPQVTDFGFGLASFLRHMQGKDPAAFVDLENALREIVPGVLRIRFDRVALQDAPTPATPATILDGRRQTRIGNLILFDTVHGSGIPAHRVSEGAMLTLGLLATLFGPSAPQLVLLEEPERALHPRAFVDFVTHLRRLRSARPELQVVMASHSPYLVSAFEPTEIQLFSVSAEGRTHCVRMDRHPDFEKWREVMVPGELWMTIDRRRRTSV